MIRNENQNKNNIVIACRMLEDEVTLAMRNTGCTLPTVWMERGLHDSPDRLRKELLAAIEAQPQAGTILLAYTLCGNAMAGVGSEFSRLVAPRFHDCIQMGLALRQGVRPAADARSLYCTRGWLLDDRSIVSSYRLTCEKYGRDKALRVYKHMLRNYESLTMLDTGAYPLRDNCEEPRALAKELSLSFKTCAGSIRVLEKLFRGEWDKEFCIAEPGARFAQEQFVE